MNKAIMITMSLILLTIEDLLHVFKFKLLYIKI